MSQQNFIIHQFEDSTLSHYSYAIVSGGEAIIIDPARNPQQYYDFADEHKAKIIGVIETHPHADFVSSHLEIYLTTGATIYVSELLGADYPHITFDEGQNISLGTIILKCLNTPGHSPDSISIVLEENGKDKAVFSGDTLFIGDCGRPDLRESAGNTTAKSEDLAKDMFHSLQTKLIRLDDHVQVYPAHGAGSLCGKGMSDAKTSTMGEEKQTNWSLQNTTETVFIKNLLSQQPFVPKYFAHDVAINKTGATSYLPSLDKIIWLKEIVTDCKLSNINPDLFIIDTREAMDFRKAHFNNSINLQVGGKFNTWLGSIISPNEQFYLLADNQNQLNSSIADIAKIGYESQIKAAFVGKPTQMKSDILDLENFKTNIENYTILDVRNESEIEEKPIFINTIAIPLHELRERIDEIPTERPIMVHCAGGYRSAAGSSIIKNAFRNATVYDLGEAVSSF